MGERPCEADYGLFGPFFRHFFCDPTPGALMRALGPHVTHWVTRLWQTRPDNLEGTPEIAQVPDDLGFFFEMVAIDYLPFLEANARAVAEGASDVSYRAQGVPWKIPAAPYRAQCFNELKRRYAELDADAARRVAELLPASAIALLAEAPSKTPQSRHRRLGRLGRPAALLD